MTIKLFAFRSLFKNDEEEAHIGNNAKRIQLIVRLSYS